MTKFLQIRQGDVLLQQVSALPDGCTELPHEGHRIVLAHGEVTGHAHAIYDHLVNPSTNERWAADLAQSTIAQAQSKAKLMVSVSGNRYLKVIESVTLRHEEHTQHVLPPGIYLLPQQVEYEPGAFRLVED